MKKLSDYKGQKVVVNCPTEQEDLEFRKLMHSEGLKWWTGRSYLQITNWSNYKENTCYYFNDGEFSDIDFYKQKGYTILPASDFLEEDFVYGQEYEFSMDNKIWHKRQFLCKTPNNRFVAWNADNEIHKIWIYARKINTERNEDIAKIKELVAKHSINQNEIF